MITFRTFLILILVGLSAEVYAIEKRALIIAIGVYPVNSGWQNLSSANDAFLMRTVLKLQGFDDKNITTLADEKATKSNILKSLENLVNLSNKSDVVVFHFSGHGQQITDQNGDELDGYDEAIIPYDAQKKISDQYKGSNHLLDDELNGFLHRLRQKVGAKGDVIFILDACHSGTATRGQEDNAIYRGTDVKFDLVKPNEQNDQPDLQKYDEQNSHSERGSEELSPFVIFSASGQQELNLEIKDQNNKGYGSLTYALSKILATYREPLIYSTLFELVRNQMCELFAGKHQQTPQLEGNTDRILFAGQSVFVPPHCSVQTVVNSAKVIVNIGELSGLTAGSEISFYPINTINPEKADLIAKGVVKQTGLIESVVGISVLTDKTRIKDAWGFVAKYAWPNGSADVNTMRANIIRRAASSDLMLKVEFEIVPIKPATAVPFNNTFKVDDSFLIRVINKGSRDAFFQIIDIQPDNQVSLLFDVTRLYPNDLFIKAGETRLIDKVTFRISKPIGMEMFKLIASDKQLDLSAITTKLPVINRDRQSTEFEQLLNDLYSEARGGSAIGNFSHINIFTRSFTIKEK